MKYQVHRRLSNWTLNITEHLGLDYDRETMKLLLDKQEKQILLLDKEARQYASKVRQKDQNIADTRERQRMMGKYLFY